MTAEGVAKGTTLASLILRCPAGASKDEGCGPHYAFSPNLTVIFGLVPRI